MSGLSTELHTKQDYLNMADSIRETDEGRSILIARLERLKASTMMMRLGDSGRRKPAEKQHQEDYIQEPDPNCEMRHLNFTETEIECLIERIKGCSNG